jgi:hypothetical protein
MYLKGHSQPPTLGRCFEADQGFSERILLVKLNNPEGPVTLRFSAQRSVGALTLFKRSRGAELLQQFMSLPR